MTQTNFQIGQKVHLKHTSYDVIYEIEKKYYGINVYKIIDERYKWIDMVPGDGLELLNDGKITNKEIK
jgi:hypothetical protein